MKAGVGSYCSSWKRRQWSQLGLWQRGWENWIHRRHKWQAVWQMWKATGVWSVCKKNSDWASDVGAMQHTVVTRAQKEYVEWEEENRILLWNPNKEFNRNWGGCREEKSTSPEGLEGKKSHKKEFTFEHKYSGLSFQINTTSHNG